MDIDIARLEAAVSPYLVLIGDTGVEYVSLGLAERLGVLSERLKEELGTVPGLTTGQHDVPRQVSLASAGNGQRTFSCIPISLEGGMLLALSEDAPRLKPLMEYADRDTFVRMFMYAPVAGLVVDGGVIVYVNDLLCSTLGMNRHQVLGSRVIDMVSKESRADFLRATQQWFDPEGGKDAIFEVMLTAASGTRFDFLAQGGWTTWGNRDVLWIVLKDVTETKKAKKALREEQQRFSELFSLFPIGILSINPRGRILESNDYVSTLMGYTREQVHGSPFTDYVDELQAGQLREDFRVLFTTGAEINKRECIINTSDGRAMTIEYNARIVTRKGHPTKALMMFTDVTEKKTLELELLEKNAEMERTLWDMAEVKDALEARAGELNKATEDLKSLNEKLNMLSITDGLTEVYNHRHFQDRLTEEMERLNRLKDGVLSLLIMDIDDFKRFNDTYGHQCGDMVLKQIAALLKGCIRTIDILARYGGEEFAVILPNSTTEQAVVVAERICETIRSTPFTYGMATNVKVTVSIGVGTITSGQLDKSELVRKADSAMYAAKAKWKDRVEIWEED